MSLASVPPHDISRPVWAAVDLTAISNNVRALQLHNGGRDLMAIVKADGYGHGAVETAKTAIAAGATWLGVALPTEGAELRQAGITAPILVLGAFYPGTEHLYIEGNLTATLATKEALQAVVGLAQRGMFISVHLKVDTGMSRLGFLPDEAIAVAKFATANRVKIDGVYTHLATADAEDTAFACEQLARFRRVLSALDNASIPIRWRHAGNSAALLQLPLTEFNLTRAGVAIYGLPPSFYLSTKVSLQPAMSLHARIVSVRRLPAGVSISYGATYVTKFETTIAVLPLGYADGYTRRLSNRVTALIGGHRFPVVGTICMDQCMVDVGDYPAQIGEEAVLMGAQGSEIVSADELADISGTINYEIVCGISARVPRVYKQ